MPIRIGTSGWSYDDWDGHVYPKGVTATDRLRWYAERFPTVEVDSTYYRDPAPGFVKGWIQKTREAPGFELSVKTPKDLTHELLVDGDLDAIRRRAEAWRVAVADPLADASRLGAILLQLSPAVIHHPRSLDRLDAALAMMRPHPTAVEFRNRTWHEGDRPRLRDDARALLDAANAAAVVVDGPPFPDIVEGAADHAYVRFHGRNADRWYRSERGPRRADRRVEDKEERYYGDRYDYLYSDDELDAWMPRLAGLAGEKDVVRVYFNNHVEGKAFRNGQQMEEKLERAEAPVTRVRSPQRRLPF
ncbi:MAG TPA: DUF72 domain-containing protein [Candidatus Thermoplasmatota archaeon]|nr:DUF72 domain-containing protein [Candidatus Thermoplasmatota archaeon]